MMLSETKEVPGLDELIGWKYKFNINNDNKNIITDKNLKNDNLFKEKRKLYEVINAHKHTENF